MRLFVRQPAILVLTIVGLSLGLGIATAAFSIMNAAVLRGEGLVDGDRAPGVLRLADRSTATEWRYDEFRRLREGATRMKAEAVVRDTAVVRTTPAEQDAPSAGVAFVTGGFFSATGGRAIAGRLLESGDEQRDGPPPVVLSFVFWSSRFNRDPQVVGRTLRIGQADATIVGVAARGFTVPSNRSLWMPMTAYGAVYGGATAKRTPDVVQVFGRLLPDATFAEAEAQLSGVAAALPRDAIAPESALRVRLDADEGLGRVPAADALATTVLVFAAIGLVLLLACANVATVLISMAIAREREMGVRAALGASRTRIVRQLVTESLALGTTAAGVGLLLAHWAIPVIATMIEAPAGADLAPDLNVYLFLGLVTLITGVAAGLAPARHGRGADLVTPLKGESAGPNRLGPRRLRSMLVMTQAAASVLLIVLATLFVRATFRAAAIDVGFGAAELYAVSAGRSGSGGGSAAGVSDFWQRAIAEVQTVPGIAAVTLTELTPFDGITRSAATRGEPTRVVHFNGTRSEYFETMGIRILAGRTFTRDEVAAGTPVALVSHSLARAYWPNQSPLGQLLPQEIPVAPSLVMGPGGPSLVASPRPIVIGVVSDAITTTLHERNALVVYEPLDTAGESFAQLLVRVTPGTSGGIQQASQRLRAIDPRIDITIASVASRVQQETSRPRMLAAITGVVGVIAIVLCVIGLYGLTASLVGQRSREMGVRAALGAAPLDLLRLLMWDSLRPVAAGLAAGAVTALIASRAVASTMFFGVSPQDPIAYAGAAAVLVAAATLAVLVPTRRAARVDAAIVLRRSF